MRDPEDPRATWEVAAVIGSAVVTMAIASLILIPVGRGLALVGLLAMVWLLARTLGREAGWTAVASAYLLALWVYGDPRFQSRIDDPQTIRLSAVVLVVGSALALLGMAQRHRHMAPRPTISSPPKGGR